MRKRLSPMTKAAIEEARRDVALLYPDARRQIPAMRALDIAEKWLRRASTFADK